MIDCGCGPMYGHFPGGDPRDFTPDAEGCTEKEIADWNAACKAMDEGTYEDNGKHGCRFLGDDKAQVIVCGSTFGIGVTMYYCEEHAPESVE